MDLCQDSFGIFSKDWPACYTSTFITVLNFSIDCSLGRYLFSFCVLQFSYYYLPTNIKPMTDTLYYQCCSAADKEGISVQ